MLKETSLLSILLALTLPLFSQTVNTVPTAVPFLTVSSDARSDGMGGVGIALSPDANAAQLNGARMAFVQNDFGVGMSFTPWFWDLANPLYLADLNGYYKIKEVQTIHTSLRYLSDVGYNYYSTSGKRLNQLFYDAGYSRKLADIVSIDATARFIYAEIDPQITAGVSIPTPEHSIAGAADISVFVDKKFDNKGKKVSHELLWGLCISNIGSKMSYTYTVTKDFLPANLGIGFGYKLHLDAKDDHTIGIYADLNKLLVPTPNEWTGNAYLYSAHQQNESPVTGLITSFYDAPGGASQEFRSITEQIGAEYWYKSMFAFRTGFFYGDPGIGGREYATIGTGFKYSVVALHFSYNLPVTSQHNPLDNTFSFALAFEFKKGILKKKKAAGTTTRSL